ncbi:MAG: hypothetical protein J5842_03030, partial [Lachnospiraceae bacterium]|nr:hypothetical protein [Lachnospiraceae bacterium]
FSENLKSTLACSSMSQIGFILTGISMMVIMSSQGNEEGKYLALSGVLLHMINHSVIKLVLFCCAGVVVMNIRRLSLKDITGWGRDKKLLKISFLFGALGISGVPVFNGYISKTLLHESITHAASHVSFGGLLKISEWIFIISGGLTFAYMLRLFIRVFVMEKAEGNAKDQKEVFPDKEGEYMSVLSGACVFIPSLLCFVLGQPPVAGIIASYASKSPSELTYKSIFSAESIIGAMISLTIGAAVYLVIVRRLENKRYKDKDSLQKKAAVKEEKGFAFARAFVGGLSTFLHMIDMGMDAPVALIARFIEKEQKKEDHHTAVYTVFDLILTGRRDESTLKESFSTALMMTCVGILIIMFVLVFTVL